MEEIYHYKNTQVLLQISHSRPFVNTCSVLESHMTILISKELLLRFLLLQWWKKYFYNTTLNTIKSCIHFYNLCLSIKVIV